MIYNITIVVDGNMEKRVMIVDDEPDVLTSLKTVFEHQEYDVITVTSGDECLKEIENGFKGIVLEGTGLGHVSSKYFPILRKAIDEEVLVGMTSQCIWGRINLNVYDTGRELLRIGVISLEDMFPETALVKMMWALGQTKDPEKAKTLLMKNVAKEFSDRTKFKEENR